MVQKDGRLPLETVSLEDLKQSAGYPFFTSLQDKNASAAGAVVEGWHRLQAEGKRNGQDNYGMDMHEATTKIVAAYPGVTFREVQDALGALEEAKKQKDLVGTHTPQTIAALIRGR